MNAGPELETVLLNQVDATDVGITAHVETKPGKPRGTLDIQLNLDPATLSLSERAGGWTGDVEEIFVQTNASGNTLAKVSDNNKGFEMTAAQRAGFDSQGRRAGRCRFLAQTAPRNSRSWCAIRRRGAWDR